MAKQTPLPEDEWQRLFKLPQEPGRLDTLLNSRQIEQYARQVDGFAAGITGKMFAVRGNLLPGAGEGLTTQEFDEVLHCCIPIECNHSTKALEET